MIPFGIKHHQEAIFKITNNSRCVYDLRGDALGPTGSLLAILAKNPINFCVRGAGTELTALLSR
jgi:hypothetical protein